MKHLSLTLVILLIHVTLMAKEIRTEITIRSTPEKVWAILTDFEKYPDWNPFIRSVTGKVEKGEKISAQIAPPQGKTMTFKPTVLTKTENRELRWLGSVLFKGLFDGEHQFELTDNGDGTVRFVHSEQFRGIFVWLFDLENTRNGFIQMNQKLKELAEAESTG